MDILLQYIPLCFFKENPLKLPRSETFFRCNLVTYYFVELFMQANMIDPWEAFWEVGIETLLTLAFVALIMMINRNYHCYLQVITAFLVCENIISIFAVPVLIWLTVTDDFFSYILFGFLIFWDFCLVTYILKNVLDVNVPASLAVSCIYFISTYGAAYSIMFLI